EPDQVTLDNVLFNCQRYGVYAKNTYFQKVCKSDIRTAQFNSDFALHTLELYDYFTDELLKSFSVILREQNLGLVEDYQISIRNHPTESGKSRVYFSGNFGGLPIALSVGDPFEILNNLEGFDGNYLITAIENDLTLNTQYL